MSTRRTQRDRILDLLRAHKGRRVPSPALGRISLQYGARIKELRDMGFVIRNEIERVDGAVHGYFLMESEPVTPTINNPASSAVAEEQVEGVSPKLFASELRLDGSPFFDHEHGRGGRR